MEGARGGVKPSRDVSLPPPLPYRRLPCHPSQGKEEEVFPLSVPELKDSTLLLPLVLIILSPLLVSHWDQHREGIAHKLKLKLLASSLRRKQDPRWSNTLLHNRPPSSSAFMAARPAPPLGLPSQAPRTPVKLPKHSADQQLPRALPLPAKLLPRCPWPPDHAVPIFRPSLAPGQAPGRAPSPPVPAVSQLSWLRLPRAFPGDLPTKVSSDSGQVPSSPVASRASSPGPDRLPRFRSAPGKSLCSDHPSIFSRPPCMPVGEAPGFRASSRNSPSIFPRPPEPPKQGDQSAPGQLPRSASTSVHGRPSEFGRLSSRSETLFGHFSSRQSPAGSASMADRSFSPDPEASSRRAPDRSTPPDLPGRTTPSASRHPSIPG